MSPSTDTAVRRSITVAAPIERAFSVFTAGFDRWWPRSHHLVEDVEMKEAVLELAPGGRWYERNADGSECDWGQVLAYEPPSRLLLAWQITTDFKPEPDPARASHIEVTFTAETPERTRVDLVHSGFERHALAGGEEIIGGEGGWTSILAGYATALAG
jgi:uncharacterized protein YndB with AHSA1/START domain